VFPLGGDLLALGQTADASQLRPALAGPASSSQSFITVPPRI
jgi:hypothetical protein